MKSDVILNGPEIQALAKINQEFGDYTLLTLEPMYGSALDGCLKVTVWAPHLAAGEVVRYVRGATIHETCPLAGSAL